MIHIGAYIAARMKHTHIHKHTQMYWGVLRRKEHIAMMSSRNDDFVKLADLAKLTVVRHTSLGTGPLGAVAQLA